MIELKPTGKCRGCSDLSVEVRKAYGDDGFLDAWVVCEHQGLCDHLERYLENRIRGQIAEERRNGEDDGNG